jgi:hypothetical protein
VRVEFKRSIMSMAASPPAAVGTASTASSALTVASPMPACLARRQRCSTFTTLNRGSESVLKDQDQARWPHGECTKFGDDGCEHRKVAFNLHRHVSWTATKTRSQLSMFLGAYRGIVSSILLPGTLAQ